MKFLIFANRLEAHAAILTFDRRENFSNGRFALAGASASSSWGDTVIFHNKRLRFQYKASTLRLSTVCFRFLHLAG